MHIYISGPMRGHEDYNYPAFHSAARDLRGQGHQVFNPAECFNGDQNRPVSEYLRQDLRAVLDASAVLALPGWEDSAGARLEIAVAAAVGVPVYLYDYSREDWTLEDADHLEFDEGDFAQFLSAIEAVDEAGAVQFTTGEEQPAHLLDAYHQGYDHGLAVARDCVATEETPESPLEEAARLVNGDRQRAYGHPFEDFSRTAAMWTAIFGHPITAEQVALAMVAVKISREVNAPKRDNIVDGIGYFTTLHMVRARRRELELAEEFGPTYGDLTVLPGGLE